MADLELSLMMGSNPRSQPVLSGAVKPDGITLHSTVGHPSEIFWRQLKFQEFDVSEMSLSSLLIAMANGNTDWVGLPVFTARRFFHTGVWVRTDRGIDKPQDLKGKRVGVPEYQQTAALWTRGALQHEWGVAPSDVAEFFMERTEDRSHGGATGFHAPPGVKLSYIPYEKNIGSMLLSGELDATLLYLREQNLVDRSTARLEDSPNMRLLFPDGDAEGRRYFAKTGLYPINHGMVVRRSIAERHPWVVLNIYNAFERAKLEGYQRMRSLAEGHLATGLVPPEDRKALSADPFPYGVQSNRKVLETLADYSYEQGLTPRRMQLDEVFFKDTLDL
jgi:4,5-dihydroxyphthalate decarboxylase